MFQGFGDYLVDYMIDGLEHMKANKVGALHRRSGSSLCRLL